MSVEPDFVSLPEIREAHAKAGRKILAEAQAVARQAGARAETRLLEIERLEQRVVDVLADEATAWPADLLVIGTHGRRGLHRMLLGRAIGALRGWGATITCARTRMRRGVLLAVAFRFAGYS